MTLNDFAAAAEVDDACNRIGQLEVQIEGLPLGHPKRAAMQDDIETLRRRVDLLESGIEYDPIPFLWADAPEQPLAA